MAAHGFPHKYTDNIKYETISKTVVNLTLNTSLYFCTIFSTVNCFLSEIQQMPRKIDIYLEDVNICHSSIAGSNDLRKQRNE